VRRGAAAADAAAARIETMWHCGACAAFGVGDDGDGDDVNGRAWTCECERAGAGAGERIGFGIAPRPTKLGPAWSGALASAAFASKMLERAVAGDGACRVEPATTSLLRRLAREASDAADVALFRSVDACVDRATGEHPNVDALVDALRREGRVASRTHFDARGVKTDASGEELRRIAAAVVERRRAEKRQKPGAGE
jgi:tRNA G26 N,N-dimethylase Trm1